MGSARPSLGPACAALLLAAGCGPAPYQIGAEEPCAAAPAPREAVITGAVAAASPAPEDLWSPDSFPRPNPFATARLWAGDFACAEGRTSVMLRVIDARDMRVRALFAFQKAEAASVGQYLLAGTYDEETGRVDLSPGVWLSDPGDYIAVGLEGLLSSDGRSFTGQIKHPSCGAFQIHAMR
ncbi:MAG: hypothetical protein U0359_42715 [Byssovorax sp.]